MNQRFIRFSALSFLVSTSAGIAGCTVESADSTDIKTSGIHAVFIAEAKGDGMTVVTGALHVASSSGTPLELKGSDALLTKVVAESKALGSTNTQGLYRASFGTEAGGSKVVVDFNRASEDVSALGSEVTLPAPFTLSLDGFAAGSAIQRGKDVNLKMEPTGMGNVSWSLSGTCIWDKSGTAGDDGTIMIPAADVDPTLSGEGKTCEVTVVIDRVNQGTLASQFKEGGSISARQRRSVAFNSTPAPGEMMQAGTGGAGSTGGTMGVGGSTSAAGGMSSAGTSGGGAGGAN